MSVSSIASQDAANAPRRKRPAASPRARRAMRRAGIDPTAIRGSGPEGRIVEADVLRAVAAPAHSAARAIASPAAIFRAQADVTLLVSLVDQMRAHAPKTSGGDFTLAGAICRARDLAIEKGDNPHLPAQMGIIPFFDVDEAAILPRGPEAGVLTIGRVTPAPGLPGRRMLRLTLWADLAAMDAKAAAGLLGRIVELVQNPLVLFLERLRS